MAINFRNRRPPLNNFALFRKIGAGLIVPSVLACALAGDQNNPIAVKDVTVRFVRAAQL